MRHYLSSDDMFCAGDRSYFLRLKNARSASRCTASWFCFIITSADAFFFLASFRVGASVGRPSVSRTVVPRCALCSVVVLMYMKTSLLFLFIRLHSSSPPIAPNPSPLSEAPRDTKSHAIKRLLFSVVILNVNCLFSFFVLCNSAAQTQSEQPATQQIKHRGYFAAALYCEFPTTSRSR